jgi:putative membrane protein
MVKNIAEANIAEIETGDLAKQKSQNAAVQRFAQRMVDDHTDALNKLKALATRKSTPLPEDTDLAHKASAVAMRALSGVTFDKQYMEHTGVGDHERTLKLLQKTSESAGDPDLRQLAAQMIPVVQQHHTMARQLEGQLKADDRAKK